MYKREAFAILKKYIPQLTRQQVRTLAGQIKQGYTDDAMRGLAKLLQRR